MPRRRKSVKRRRTRKGKGRKVSRRRRMGRPSSTVLKGPSGLPDNIFVKMRYCIRFQATHAAGIGAEYFISGNSIYRPDNSGGSNSQPYTFDQWATLYGYYTVYGASIKAQQCFVTATHESVDMAVFPIISNITIVGSNISHPVEEFPYCKYKIGSTYTSGSNDNILRSYISTAKIFGASPLAIKSEDNYSAAVTANPVNRWYWCVITQPTNVTEGPAITTEVILQLVYYVEFSGRQWPAAS